MKKFRQYISEAHLKDDEDYEFELTEDKLEQYFYIFNDKYFDNKLKGLKFNIVHFNKNLRNDAIGYLNITLNFEKEIIICNSININADRIHGFIGFRNTLIHEMLHYYVYTYFPPSNKLWKRVKTKYRTQIQNNSLTETDLLNINNILGIDEEESHNGKWQEMLSKLKIKYPELDGINAKGNGDIFSIDKDFYDNFIETYTVFLNINEDIKTIHVLKTNSIEYKNLLTVIERGDSLNSYYIGEWYKLKISDNLDLFDLLIIKHDLYQTAAFSNTKIIDYCESLKCFEKEKIGTIKQKISENIDNIDWSGITINEDLF